MTNEEIKNVIKYMIDKIQDRRKLIKLLTTIKHLQ